jgi:GNAT superfamily N-acetyltransferase
MCGKKYVAEFCDRSIDVCHPSHLIQVLIPTERQDVIEELAKHSFKTVEIFVQFYRKTGKAGANLSGTIIREAVASDLDTIAKIYEAVTLPNRVAKGGRFDFELAYALHHNRFKEVFDQRSDNSESNIFVAEYYGKFAGAVIASYTKDPILKVKVNPTLGTGMVVAPEFRRTGVGSALINFVNKWFKKQGVEWELTGASFKGQNMINALIKLGFEYQCMSTVMHRR